MNELYEIAKEVDVIVVFFIIYGCIIACVVNMITEFCKWVHNKWKKHREKKKLKTLETNEK